MTLTACNVDYNEQQKHMNSFQLENGNLFVNIENASCDACTHILGPQEKLIHPPRLGVAHMYCKICSEQKKQPNERCGVPIRTDKSHSIGCSVLGNQFLTIKSTQSNSTDDPIESEKTVTSLSDPLISSYSQASKKSNCCSLCISIIAYLGSFLLGIGTVVGAVYINDYFGINS